MSLKLSSGGRHDCRSCGSFLGCRKIKVAHSHSRGRRSHPAPLRSAAECGRAGLAYCGSEDCSGRRLPIRFHEANHQALAQNSHQASRCYSVSIGSNSGFETPRIAQASFCVRTTCRFGRVCCPCSSNIRPMPKILGEEAIMHLGREESESAGGKFASSRIVSGETSKEVTADISRTPAQAFVSFKSFTTAR